MSRRVSILWTHPSGYLDASVRALTEVPDVSVQFVSMRPSTAAPIGGSWAHENANGIWLEDVDAPQLLCEVQSFAPDLLLVCSWIVPAYRKVAASLRGSTVRAVFLDNQWFGTPKQRAGQLLARVVRDRLFDMALVAGDRQRVFARHMGFDDRQIVSGGYCANTAAFLSPASPAASTAHRTGFATAARLSPEKGLSTLLEAYQRYRALVPDPWTLTIAGSGAPTTRTAGVEYTGFLREHELAALLWRSSCFVLPSSFEPWGVALHEAAAAGMFLVATEKVGAADWFLVDGLNGALARSGDVASLVRALLRAHQLDEADMVRARQASQALASAHVPSDWAAAVLELLPSVSS